MGVKVILIDKELIGENTGSSRVNKGLHRKGLRCVGSFEDDKKVQGSFTDVKNTDGRT